MKIKNNILFVILSLFLINLFTIKVYASDLDWPIQVEADDETTPVIEESIPQTTVAPINNNINETSLSPIENNNADLKDNTIFGEDYDLVNRLTKTTTDNKELSQVQRIYSNYSDVVPVVSLDQMVEWIFKKGNELISILQILVQPFAIIFFIISAIVALIGTLMKGNLGGKGIVGMISSALVYAACLYAPVLVNSVTSFLAG